MSLKPQPSPEILMESYKIYIEEIRRSKNLQWQVANYSVLVQVAIFTAIRYVKGVSEVGWLLWLGLGLCFIIASVFVLVLSKKIMHSYNINIEDYRLHKDTLVKELNLNYYKIWREPQKGIDLSRLLSLVMLMFATFNVLYILISNPFNHLLICLVYLFR